MVDSTIKVEDIVATMEVVWIKKFITKLEIVPSILDPVNLYCDYNGAIAHAKDSKSHQPSKHILQCFHLICDFIDIRDVKICRVLIDNNIMDSLIKPLS